jgi:DNA end-binding protein Ku
MAPRANWKGHLKLDLVSCPVALYTAASEADRISFHTLNRATGHRLRREFVDQESGKPVERTEQVKGFEVGKGDYLVLTDEDIEEAIPESTKVIDTETFVASDDIDKVFLDKPYYLAPSDESGQEAFAIIREAMKAKNAVGIARTVLFRRDRVLMLRPFDQGITATTLHFDYEVRDAKAIFKDVPKVALPKEMIDLAKHIIRTKRGKFDPETFDDRYEEAVAELIKAKQAGREIKAPPAPANRGNVVNLLDALRKSAGGAGERKRATKKPAARKTTRKRATAGRHQETRRKAS